jgi:hypothetical protein
MGNIKLNLKESVDERHHEILRSRWPNFKEWVRATKLYTHNKNVDEINDSELSSISGDERIFQMTDSAQKT